ncbi:MAG: hypothetical protein RL497_2492 [Pseudomonadota bacterium]
MTITALFIYLLLIQSLAMLAGVIAHWQLNNLWVAIAVFLSANVVGTYWIVRRLIAPRFWAWQGVLQGLHHFADGEFSVALPDWGEAADLAQMRRQFNLSAEHMRKQRFSGQQREIMLQTLLEQINSALILIDPHGKIVIGNPAACELFALNNTRHTFHTLVGRDWHHVLEDMAPNLAGALKNEREGLITLETADGLNETWQLNFQRLEMLGCSHSLWHIKPLTQALNRAEVHAWKNLIRVLSHELNNSLGPMQSLSNSGIQWVKNLAPEPRQILTEIFTTLSERTEHLSRFLLAYAQIARLPKPHVQLQNWGSWLSGLKHLCPLHIIAPPPERPGLFDSTQLNQVLINLVKNSIEAGSPQEAITLSIQNLPQWDLMRLEDKGSGMAPHVLAQALLPFYSTKREGTGLGLALCREIIEAHDGRLYLHNQKLGGLRVDIWLPCVTCKI